MNRDREREGIPLLTRIIFLIFVLLVMGMGLLAIASYRTGIRTTDQLAVSEMRRTASLIATAHSLFETPDWSITKEYAETILSLYTEDIDNDFIELFYIFIEDNREKLRVKSVNYQVARKYGIAIVDARGEPLNEKSFSSEDVVTPFEKQLVPHLNRVVMPVVINGQSRGTIEVGYIVTGLAAEEEYSLKQTLGIYLFLCLVGASLALVMVRRDMQPIISTVHAMNEVKRGNLDISVKEAGNRETLSLTKGFNSMIEEIRRSNAEIRQKGADLEEAERKYRSVFQMAGDCILIVDESGICTDANFAAERLFEKPVQQLLNSYVMELVRPSITGDFNSLPTRWEGVVNVAGRVGSEVEAHTAGLDDKSRIVIFQDISSRKKAERRVDMVRLAFFNHMDDIPAGVIFFDNDLKIRFANRLIRRALFLEPDVNNISIDDLNKRFAGMDIETAVATVLRKKQDMILKEVTVNKSDGTRHEVEIKINLFTDSLDESPQAIMIVIL